jgi:hypothetical protein
VVPDLLLIGRGSTREPFPLIAFLLILIVISLLPGFWLAGQSLYLLVTGPAS